MHTDNQPEERRDDPESLDVETLPGNPDTTAHEEIDEFGHVGLTNPVKFSPAEMSEEFEKLQALFEEHDFEGDINYFGRLLNRGWTADRVNDLLKTHQWYAQQIGTAVDLALSRDALGGIGYDDNRGRWVLALDLTAPPFQFGRFEKYEDIYLLHEHTHYVQGALLHMRTREMLNSTYDVGQRKKFRAALGFRDWEQDFGMPPLFFKADEISKLDAAGIRGADIARQARDIHADSTALRSGYMHVKVNEQEAALGLTPKSKVLLEYMFEALNYIPENLEKAYGEAFQADMNIPLIARFRSLCGGILQSVETLPEAEKYSMVKCLDIVAARVESAGLEGYSIADIKGDTIEDRLKWMMNTFDLERFRISQNRRAYDILVDTYSRHLLLCIDRKKALEAVGQDGLLEALNDEEDPGLRARVAHYIGELKQSESIAPLTARMNVEADESVQRALIDAGVEILGEHYPAHAIEAVRSLFASGDFKTYLGNADRIRLATQKDPDEGVRLLKEQVNGGHFFTLFFNDSIVQTGRERPEEVLAEIIQPLLDEDYWEYKSWGIRILGKIGRFHPLLAIPKILEGADSEIHPPVTQERGMALGETGCEHPDLVLPEATRLLGCTGPEGIISYVAVGRIGQRHFDRALAVVTPLLTSPDQTIRNNAIAAIGELASVNPRKAARALEGVIKGCNEDNWLHLGAALGSIGKRDKELFDSAVKRLLASSRKEQRKAGFMAVAMYGREHGREDNTRDALETLKAQVRRSDVMANFDLAFAMAELSSARISVARPFLEEMIRDSDYDTRLTAALTALSMSSDRPLDSWELLQCVKDDVTVEILVRRFQDCGLSRKPEFWDLDEERIPAIIPSDAEAMRGYFQFCRERMQETGWSWTNVNAEEQDVGTMCYLLRELGIKADDEGIAEDMAKLFERDGKSSFSFLDLQYTARLLGISLPFDAETASSITKRESWSDAGSGTSIAEYHIQRRMLGLPDELEQDRSLLLSSLDHYREHKGGENILKMHYYLRELGLASDVPVTDDDMRLIQHAFNEKRAKTRGMELAEMHYWLRQVISPE